MMASNSDSDSNSNSNSNRNDNTERCKQAEKKPFTLDGFQDLWRRAERSLGYSTEQIEKGPLVTGANNNSNNMYGRIREGALEYIFNIMDLKPNDIFIDLGHGIGMPSLQAAYTRGCEARGIESVDDRYLISSRFQSELADGKKELRHEDVDHKDKYLVGDVELRLGDIKDIENKQFIISANKVLVNNAEEIFGSSRYNCSLRNGHYPLNDHIAKLFAQMKPDTIMVSCAQITALGRSVKEENECRVQMVLPPHPSASFFECEVGDIGTSAKTWGGDMKPLRVWVYTRTHSNGFLCSQKECPGHMECTNIIQDTIEHIVDTECLWGCQSKRKAPKRQNINNDIHFQSQGNEEVKDVDCSTQQKATHIPKKRRKKRKMESHKNSIVVMKQKESNIDVTSTSSSKKNCRTKASRKIDYNYDSSSSSSSSSSSDSSLENQFTNRKYESFDGDKVFDIYEPGQSERRSQLVKNRKRCRTLSVPKKYKRKISYRSKSSSSSSDDAISALTIETIQQSNDNDNHTKKGNDSNLKDAIAQIKKPLIKPKEKEIIDLSSDSESNDYGISFATDEQPRLEDKYKEDTSITNKEVKDIHETTPEDVKNSAREETLDESKQINLSKTNEDRIVRRNKCNISEHKECSVSDNTGNTAVTSNCTSEQSKMAATSGSTSETLQHSDSNDNDTKKSIDSKPKHLGAQMKIGLAKPVKEAIALSSDSESSEDNSSFATDAQPKGKYEEATSNINKEENYVNKSKPEEVKNPVREETLDESKQKSKVSDNTGITAICTSEESKIHITTEPKNEALRHSDSNDNDSNKSIASKPKNVSAQIKKSSAKNEEEIITLSSDSESSEDDSSFATDTQSEDKYEEATSNINKEEKHVNKSKPEEMKNIAREETLDESKQINLSKTNDDRIIREKTANISKHKQCKVSDNTGIPGMTSTCTSEQNKMAATSEPKTEALQESNDNNNNTKRSIDSKPRYIAAQTKKPLANTTEKEVIALSSDSESSEDDASVVTDAQPRLEDKYEEDTSNINKEGKDVNECEAKQVENKDKEETLDESKQIQTHAQSRNLSETIENRIIRKIHNMSKHKQCEVSDNIKITEMTSKCASEQSKMTSTSGPTSETLQHSDDKYNDTEKSIDSKLNHVDAQMKSALVKSRKEVITLSSDSESSEDDLSFATQPRLEDQYKEDTSITKKVKNDANECKPEEVRNSAIEETLDKPKQIHRHAQSRNLSETIDDSIIRKRYNISKQIQCKVSDNMGIPEMTSKCTSEEGKMAATSGPTSETLQDSDGNDNDTKKCVDPNPKFTVAQSKKSLAKSRKEASVLPPGRETNEDDSSFVTDGQTRPEGKYREDRLITKRGEKDFPKCTLEQITAAAVSAITTENLQHVDGNDKDTKKCIDSNPKYVVAQSKKSLTKSRKEINALSSGRETNEYDSGFVIDTQPRPEGKYGEDMSATKIGK